VNHLFGGLTGRVRRDAGTSSRNAKVTLKFGQDACGLCKRNTGAAEAAIIHQKIEVRRFAIKHLGLHHMRPLHVLHDMSPASGRRFTSIEGHFSSLGLATIATAAGRARKAERRFHVIETRSNLDAAIVRVPVRRAIDQSHPMRSRD
jgi:hypothetical protein